MSVIESVSDFRSLSIRDLLEAREQYHWHLTNRRNVVGTAIGLYLIRRDDDWPDADHPREPRSRGDRGERTLRNSEVRPYSWPCVLAFVDTWVPESGFSGDGLHPQDMVPETLYLPDGRMVPVCVVLVEPGEASEDVFTSTVWPASRAGGGFGLVVRSQKVEHRATAGCLVSDGHTLYVLTNRHVCGGPGQKIEARTRGGTTAVGVASDRQLTRMPFEEVYPTFAGDNTYMNLDAGLVEVDDANAWTSTFYGLGDVGEPVDLNEANIGLQLIDRPVVAYGAASGNLKGSIKALFYRYKSLGGYDYVADLLLAPDTPGTSTQPGDSGTVWHLVVTGADGHESLHPLAVEWGAQTFDEDRTGLNFALATNLSGICRLLDVELVTEHNTAARPFWGATGHYTIAAAAVAGLTDAQLGPFLQANADAISYDRGQLRPGRIQRTVEAASFVPLADVPDVVWKDELQLVPDPSDPGAPPRSNGGRGRRPDNPENPTHYCDIDQPGKPDGVTLLAHCLANPDNVAVAFWQRFYDAAGSTAQAARGCLPFRVWQFYDAMVAAVRAGRYTDYLCAAGILAHYVGDACQPLHGSIFTNGDPNHTTTHVDRRGRTQTELVGAGVHSAYETRMIDQHTTELFAAIDANLRTPPATPLPALSDGHDVAVAIIALMSRAATAIPPPTIVSTYVAFGADGSPAAIDGLWAAFGAQTAVVMADGIRVLQQIWTAAWNNGGGAPAGTDLGMVAQQDLIDRYKDITFVPSLDLDHIGAALVV